MIQSFLKRLFNSSEASPKPLDRAVAIPVRFDGRMGRNLPGESVAITNGGLTLSSNHDISPGDILDIKVFLRSDELFPIRLRGICQWSLQKLHEPCVSGLDLSSSERKSLEILVGFLKDR